MHLYIYYYSLIIILNQVDGGVHTATITTTKTTVKDIDHDIQICTNLQDQVFKTPPTHQSKTHGQDILIHLKKNCSVQNNSNLIYR